MKSKEHFMRMKAELDEKITDLIKEFEDDTGCVYENTTRTGPRIYTRFKYIGVVLDDCVHKSRLL